MPVHGGRREASGLMMCKTKRLWPGISEDVELLLTFVQLPVFRTQLSQRGPDTISGETMLILQRRSADSEDQSKMSLIASALVSSHFKSIYSHWNDLLVRPTCARPYTTMQ